MCGESSMMWGDVASWLVLWLALACSGVAVAVEEKLRIGGVASLSGPLAEVGQDWIRGWTFWAETLNVQGGLELPGVTVLKVDLPLPVVDDKSIALDSPVLLRDMLSGGPTSSPVDLDFIVGPSDMSSTINNAAEAAKANRLLFSSIAADQPHAEVARIGENNLFSVLLPSRLSMESALTSLHAEGARSVVIAHEASPLQTEICRAANRTASNLGMTVAAAGIEYPVGSTSFSPIVQDIKLLNPDVYIQCGQLEDIQYLFFSMSVLNVNTPAILMTNAFDDAVVRSVGEKNSHGILSISQWHATLNYHDEDGFFGTATNFADAYATRFGANVSITAAAGAASGYALQLAIGAAGSTDTASVRTALWELQADSFFGRLAFAGPNAASGLVGAAINRSMVLTQVQAGEVHIVGPPPHDVASVIYPLPSWSQRNLIFHPCPLGAEEGGVDAAGATICRECQPGQYRDSFTLQCTDCTAGYAASQPMASKCDRCPPGRHSGAASGSSSCEECPAGFRCPGGTYELAACPPGHFCTVASVRPSPCPEGMHREEEGGTNLSSCEPCHPGSASSKVGLSACEECPPGSFEEETGQLECNVCPRNTFQALTGQTACEQCNATFTTNFAGGEEAAACVCARGSYLNRRDGKCEPCPGGALCLGGEVMPFAKEGYFLRLMGSAELPHGDPNAVHGVQVWRCPIPSSAFCPAEIKLDDSLVGSDGISMVRLPDDCPSRHKLGVVCYWCEDGYYFDGDDCIACGALMSPHIVWALLFVLVVVTFIIYLRAGKPVPKSFPVALWLSGTVGMMLQFMQVTSLVVDFSLEMPSEVTDRTYIFEVALFDLAKVPAVCVSQPDFRTQYLVRTLGPWVIASLFFVNWLVSIVLNFLTRGWVQQLSFDHSLNVCGLAVQALYLALCKIGLQYVECRSHASAPDTLVAFPSVLCWSEEHWELAPAGFAAITVNMVGVFTAFSYINAIAPVWYSRSHRFRNRYRFLVIRWRPDKWYWGMVKSCTSLLITLVPTVVANDGVIQVALVLMLVGFSMTMQAVHSPWRDLQNNWADQFMQASLCVFFVLSLTFAEEATTNDDEVAVVRYVTLAINIFVGTAGVTLVWILAYAIFLWREREDQLQWRTGEVTGLAGALHMLSKKLADIDVTWLAGRLNHYPQGDLAHLEEALVLLGYFSNASRLVGVRSSVISASFRDMYWHEANALPPLAGVSVVASNPSALSNMFGSQAVPSLAGIDVSLRHMTPSGKSLRTALSANKDPPSPKLPASDEGSSVSAWTDGLSANCKADGQATPVLQLKGSPRDSSGEGEDLLSDMSVPPQLLLPLPDEKEPGLRPEAASASRLQGSPVEAAPQEERAPSMSPSWTSGSLVLV